MDDLDRMIEEFKSMSLKERNEQIQFGIELCLERTRQIKEWKENVRLNERR